MRFPIRVALSALTVGALATMIACNRDRSAPTGPGNRNPFYDPNHEIMPKASPRVRLYDRRVPVPQLKEKNESGPEELRKTLLAGWDANAGSAA